MKCVMFQLNYYYRPIYYNNSFNEQYYLSSAVATVYFIYQNVLECSRQDEYCHVFLNIYPNMFLS